MSRDTTLQSDIGQLNRVISPDGTFKRKDATFRSHVLKGGEFAPEKGRYHLYVSYACPWAHRTLIFRELKGLQDILPVSVVSPRMGSQGWPFANTDEFPGATTDPVNHAQHVKDFYLKVDPNYDGRFTVPVLWDKKTGTIVNNESSEIIRIFNSEFNDLISPEKAQLDLYPKELREQIDELNDWVYNTVNNGVYKSGFASTQTAYEAAVYPLFDSLDRLEKILEGKDYLIGSRLTEADVRLFTTMVRFDPVYHGHFKCNFRTIRGGYPNINRWMKNLYWNNDAFKSTTNFDHIKTHYYWSHTTINPSRVVPAGPVPLIEPLN
ncbi:glutathione S-transferase [Gautieria morchelliformis]|nr:glutathione S-transferase [Gautieria morchelliformis]